MNRLLETHHGIRPVFPVLAVVAVLAVLSAAPSGAQAGGLMDQLDSVQSCQARGSGEYPEIERIRCHDLQLYRILQLRQKQEDLRTILHGVRGKKTGEKESMCLEWTVSRYRREVPPSVGGGVCSKQYMTYRQNYVELKDLFCTFGVTRFGAAAAPHYDKIGPDRTAYLQCANWEIVNPDNAFYRYVQQYGIGSYTDLQEEWNTVYNDYELNREDYGEIFSQHAEACNAELIILSIRAKQVIHDNDLGCTSG